MEPTLPAATPAVPTLEERLAAGRPTRPLADGPPPEPDAAPATGAPVAAPVLPGPPPPRQAAREDRVRRSRRSRLGLAGLVGVVVLAIGAWALFGRGGDTGSDDAAGAGRTQSTVVLQVVGPGTTALSSALLAHDTAGDGSGAAVLIPSALVVDLPGFGSVPYGQTAVLSKTAPALAVSQTLGIIVDGSWALTAAGLAGLVDAVGGVEVEVDREVLRTDAGGTTTVLVPAGPQRLDGPLAAAYATYLAPGEPEQSRLARFTDVLQGVLAGLPAEPAEVTALLGSLGAGSTSTVPADRLGSFLAALGADQRGDRATYQNLPVRTVDVGSGAPAYVVDPEPTEQLVSSVLAGSLPPQRAGGPVRVLVQNGVGTPGLGEQARGLLVEEGFTYVNGGNANRFGYRTSVVLIRDASAAARTQGAEVAAALGLPESDLRVAAQGQSVADVVVILGADFAP
jgi:hypothetical protein